MQVNQSTYILTEGQVSVHLGKSAAPGVPAGMAWRATLLGDSGELTFYGSTPSAIAEWFHSIGRQVFPQASADDVGEALDRERALEGGDGR